MYSIMIIDDDESIGNMEQELLEREGYLVQRAYSGTEALLLLQQKRPELILLDLMLPGMSGEKLLSIFHLVASETRYCDCPCWKSGFFGIG